MKKMISLVSLSFVLIMSLACQQITNLGQDDSSPTPKIVNTIIPPTATMLVATPIPTESLPPAEGWIAFVNQNNVWLIHPDGSGLTQITTNTDSSTQRTIRVQWSPDGQKLAYTDKNRLYMLDISTLKVIPLAEEVFGGFDWARSSNQIVFDTPIIGEQPLDWYNDGFWKIDINTGKKEQIVRSNKDYPAIVEPQWSPDGSYIIFTEPEYFEPSAFYGVINLNTGLFTELPLRKYLKTL